MRLFTLLCASFASCSLWAMPCAEFQDVGTTNLSFCSTGNATVTVGVLEYENIKAEVGVNYYIKEGGLIGLGAKVGFDECVYNEYAPSFAVGVFNAGIKTRNEVVSTQNVFYAITSKSFFRTKAYAGAFHGNETMGEFQSGAFVGLTQHLIVYDIDETHQRSKLDLTGEYVGGDSRFAGAKVELKYLISQSLSIKAGPVWDFNKVTLETSKWSLQKATWIIGLSVDV